MRVETLSSHQEDLKREVAARDAVVESLRGELGKADARFNELKRGAEFKIKLSRIDSRTSSDDWLKKRRTSCADD